VLQQTEAAGVLKNHHGDNVSFSGNWAEKYFGNSNPVVLELGCGKGEYSLALARNFKGKNFIGIDIKGPRIWKGAKTALEENLGNLVFLRAPIENLRSHFAPAEVDEIWITFADPFPRVRSAKHRLTAPAFLELYREISKPGTLIHLKTDSLLLYNYSIDSVLICGGRIFESSTDIHGSMHPADVLKILTHYEQLAMKDSQTIKYLCFGLHC
jgi:tRNA (guanine-N7-)-methyltransferase